MFAFTFVARLFKFQYDKPHFVPLLRLPPKQGKGRSSNPLIISSLFWVVGKITLQILPRFFCVVSTLFPFSSIVEMLKTGDLGG